MSAAQKIMQQGTEQGIQQDMLIKAREVAKSMLQEGLTMKIIEKVMGLTGQELEKLK
jgi:hypothetical protein